MLPTSILGSSLGIIDSSVVNVALPKVKSELGVGFEASQCVANALLLAPRTYKSRSIFLRASRQVHGYVPAESEGNGQNSD